MRDILRHSNRDLLRDIEYLVEALKGKSGLIPAELDTYYDWVLSQFNNFHKLVTQNIRDLDSTRDDILPEILSNTQSVTQMLYLFNQRLVSPILRARPSDRLCLKLLRWLHSTHPKTRAIPAVLSDGDFASWPVPPWPTIYFMPPSAQQRLLYLPLFFHEFGHLLYASHKPEMDDLVRDLQIKISELLTPSTHRDDSYAQRESEQRSVIVETWYSWAQELFCDVVGLVIGGPAFAYAFSMHLQMMGRGQYHLPPEQLARRVHPVTWLRVRIVADHARRMGFEAEAQALENRWQIIAEAMGTTEDYYGFYIPGFLPAISKAIDDMLTETNPRRFTKEEVAMLESELPILSPVRILNQAWHKFLHDAENYPTWEMAAIDSLLHMDLPRS